MFAHYRTKAFIVKKAEEGEADRVFTVFSENFGKLELLAKAERKIASKLRCGLEMFNLSEIEFIQGKKRKTITDAILIDNFKEIKKDLKKTKAAYRTAEAVDELINGQEEDKAIWLLLKEFFEDLKSASLPFLAHYCFIWNFLSVLGFSPQLYNCCFCQKRLSPEALYFSAEAGGLVCCDCKSKLEEKEKVDAETIKIIRIFLKGDRGILRRLKVGEKDLRELKEISDIYFLKVLDGTR